MTTDIASLGVKIDTSEVKISIAELDKLAAAGVRAEKSTDQLTKATAGGVDAARTAARAVREQATATEAAAKAQAAHALGTSATTAAIGKSAAAAQQAGASFNSLAAGQKMTAYQSQQLSFQLNDLFVQIASGQSPITALIQQGSQLNGQFGGLGGTLRAVGSVFTVARVAIAGVAGAVFAVGAAFMSGRNQTDDFNKSIALTGNAAGITEGRFNAMAKSIADTTNTTIGSTRETLQGLVSSGRFTGDALEAAGRAAQSMGKVSGESANDIVKSFIKAGGSVADFARQANDQYHFLTATQLAYIKTLEDQGESQKALEITFNALNGRMDLAAGKLGTLERAWNSVKAAASRAIDTMADIGRGATPEDAVANIQQQIKALDDRQSFNPAATAARRAALVEQLEIQKKLVEQGQAAARASAKAIETEKAKTDFMRLQDQTLTRSEIRAKEIAKANALADKAGANAVERAKVIANIEEKYKDPKTATPKAFQDDAGAKFLESLRQQTAVLQEQLASTAKLTDAEREQLKFAQLLADLKGKTVLTSDQKSLQSAKDKINAQLQINVLTEREIGFKKIIEDYDKRRADAEKATANTVTGNRVRNEDGLTQQREQYDDRLGAVGKGSQAAEELRARQQVEREYARMQSQLTKQAAENSTLEGDAYKQGVIDIAKARADALDINASYFKRFREMQSDSSLGASHALADYRNDAANVFKQTETLVGNSLGGLENSFVRLAATGKLSFKDLANSVIADMARMQAKAAVSGIASLLGSALSNFKYSGSSTDPTAGNYENQMDRGKFAKGGVLSSPGLSAYSGTIVSKPTIFPFAKGTGLMGEAGPEAILPLRRGSDGKLGVAAGGGGGAIEVNIINNGAPATAEVQQSQNADGSMRMDIILKAIKSSIAGDINTGSGEIPKAMGNRFGSKTSTR